MEDPANPDSNLLSGALPRLAPRLFERMPAGVDLRDAGQHESLLATADALVARVDQLAELDTLDWLLAAEPEQWPLGARVAVKLARSKALLARRRAPLHLSVVLPVYAEHERILRPAEGAMGEAFLDRKLRQLDWLLGASTGRSFELLVIDDGCPHGSGVLAEEILSRRHPGAPARVLYLEDAIRDRVAVVESLRSTDQSRKGGSVQLGLWEATRVSRLGHVVVYTDADLSTHLGQAGLLVDALDAPGIRVAAGSRRGRTSVVVKSGRRSARGRLFIYLWKRLLPELAYLEDTQCGFKAMPALVARQLVDRPTERGFAFDLELLLRAELGRRRSIAKVPIAWIDSEAASTTVGLSPYLPMLRSAVDLCRREIGRRPSSEPFARVIETLDDASWQRMIDRFGPQLEAIDPALDGDHAHIPASELLAGVL